jgi:hypothetical protein
VTSFSPPPEPPGPPIGSQPTGVPGGGGALGGIAGQVAGAVGGGRGAVGGLFGAGDAIRQILLWQVAGELISPILAPVQQAIANQVWTRFPDVPISPAGAAEMVVKNHISMEEGTAQANKSGVSRGDFEHMVKSTGEPISIQEALFLLRRQKIDRARLTDAVHQSRVRDEWIDAILMLATQPIGAAEAVAATVQHQIPYAEGEKIAYENGLEAPDFKILVDTHGRPPGAMELVEMVRRGHIPAIGTGPDATSLDQGIAESDIKDKWTPVYHALLEYLPPPRTVTALLRAGSITHAQALSLFQKAGLSPELAGVYVANASHDKVATEKQLTKDTITKLYEERLITHDQAVAMLEHLHYTAEESAFVLQLGDLQRHQRVYNAAVTRIATLYIGRKLEAGAVSAALDSLGVPAAQRDEYLTVWALERASNLKILSEATIAQAWKYGVLQDDDALAELEAHGYTPHDAWVYLAVHNKGTGPAGPMPARDAIHGLM